MSHNLRAYTKALYTFDAVVRRVRPDQWATPSPNPGWTVAETVGHVVWSQLALAAAVDGKPLPPIGDEAGYAGPDPATAWSQALDHSLAALDQQGSLTTEIPTPLGPMATDDALGLFGYDPLAHTWDVATACSIDPALPHDLAEQGLAKLAEHAALIEKAKLFGPPADVANDANAVDQFLAATGRQP